MRNLSSVNHLIISSITLILFLNTGFYSVIKVGGDEVELMGEPQGFHSPIIINSDSKFTSANGVSGGSGRSDDPYIIENLIFNTTSVDGIQITNTDSNFKINNCTFFGPMNSIHQTYYGIYLKVVSNGLIVDCEFVNNEFGLYVEDCENISTTDSIFQGFKRYGVWVRNSKLIEIENNNLDSSNPNGCGISFGSGIGHSIVFNNTFLNLSYGIKTGSNITIENNTIIDTDTGISMDGNNNYDSSPNLGRTSINES